MTLQPHLEKILESMPYPAFSAQEMGRRHRLLEEAISETGVDHVVLYGTQRSGTAVPWLTGWPVTREAAVIITPGERDVLLVQFFNHVPAAREIAASSVVWWGGPSTIGTAVELLNRRGAAGGRIGVIGALPHTQHDLLAEAAREVVDLNGAYTSMRMVKSAEEVDWLRIGAWLSDQAITALRRQARPGLSEHELVSIIEDAYLSRGGATHIHYLGVTSMTDPNRCVPSQIPSQRRLQEGDVIFSEISASFWGYPGQVLRTYTVGRGPTPLYGRLHDVASAAYEAIAAVIRAGAHAQDVVDAAGVIESAGFSIYDDLVHGFGGGYLPPVLGSSSRQNSPVPDFTFRTGMTVVIQPNVITPDQRAGVQVGELVLITDDGVESLHTAQRGLLETLGRDDPGVQ